MLDTPSEPKRLRLLPEHMALCAEAVSRLERVVDELVAELVRVSSDTEQCENIGDPEPCLPIAVTAVRDITSRVNNITSTVTSQLERLEV